MATGQMATYPSSFPPQHQNQQPGIEAQMQPRPVFDNTTSAGAQKLAGKTAIITGGDSGIGRAVALAFAKEGADVVIAYLNEHQDAEETKQAIERCGQRCLTISGDVGTEAFCNQVIAQTKETFGKLDILVNNAAEQHPQPGLEQITEEQLTTTFRTNIFSYFFMTKAALAHLRKGSVIINTASITAYQGSEQLLDYSATKGAVVAFTRSLAKSLVGRGIRVNGVAPGPIWTPLIPATFPPDQVASFGSTTPMKRAGQPVEVAPCYVFLACDENSYMTGQMLHVNGGDVVNG